MLESFTHFFHFRNENHAVWFLMTFTLSMAVIALSIYLRNTLSLLSAGTAFLFVSMAAVKYVIIDNKPSNTFSTDCIWYNALIAMFHYGTYFYVVYKNSRAARVLKNNH